MVVFRREVGFGGGLVFTEKVINRSPNASSIAAGCADFLPSVCSYLELRQFTTALQSITPSCSRFGLSVGLEFLSSRRATFRVLRHSSLYHGRCGRTRRTTVFDGAISSRRAVMILLYCAARLPMPGSKSSGVHRVVDLSRLMKSADVNVFHERRVVMT